MAPLPENNTARVWVDYHDGINPHSLMFRSATDTDVEGALTLMADFLAAVAPILHVITVTGARYSNDGSTISLPVTWTGASTYGTFAMPANLAPRALTFLGRDNTGRRVRWSLYGGSYTTPGTFRIAASAEAAIQDGIDVLHAANLSGHALTIAGLDPVVYPYADVNFNSYWEAEQRP